MAELKINITADVANSLQGLSAVQIRAEQLKLNIEKLQNVIANTTSQRKLESALKALSQQQSALNKVVAASPEVLKRLQGLSNAATQSLLNLSRVAQDAPFGFLGIANNLNPLLESFQRLKAESGSSKTALKSLASSLMGAGGLGLALGVASSLLIVFGDRLFGSGKKAKESADKIKELLIPIAELTSNVNAGAAGSTAGAIAEVNALSKAVLDQTKSYNERNNALNQLKEINKNYFGDLTVEKAALGGLKTAVDEYTQALVANAVVKGFTDEISKLSVELSKQKDILKGITDGMNGVSNAAGKVRTFNAAEGLTSTTNAAGQASAFANKEFEKQSKTVGLLQFQYDQLIEKINGAVNATLKFKPLTSPTIKADKIKVDLKSTSVDFEGLNDLLSDEFNANLKKNGGFRFNVDSGLLEFVERDLTDIEKIFKDAQGRLKSLKPIDVSALFVGFNQAAEQAKILQENAIVSANIINGSLAPAFDGLFQSIFEGGNALQGFFEGLKQGVQQLIGKLIQAAAFAAVLSAITGGAGGGGLGFLSAFKQILGFRAEGGPVGANSPYIVGEKGPELFVPSVNGNIIPNNRMGNVSSGGVSVIVNGEFVQRGRDMVAVIALENNARGRKG